MNSGKVLGHSRYWTLPFLRLYLQRAEAALHEHAEDGFLYAVHAPELARRTPVGEKIGFHDVSEQRSFRLMALGILGSAAHAYGELTKAEASFVEGKLLLDDDLASGCLSNFLWRVLVFEHGLGRSVAPLVKRAEMLEHLEDQNRGRLALVQAVLAIESRAGGGAALGDVLRISGVSRQSEFVQLRNEALHLALCAVRSGRLPLSEQHALLPIAASLRREGVYTLSRRDKSRLLWIEAYVHCQSGLGRYGVKLFERARRLADALTPEDTASFTSDYDDALRQEHVIQ